MKKRIRFILINLATIFLLSFLIPPTAKALPQNTLNNEVKIEIFIVKLEVSTDSDWTIVKLGGIQPFKSNVSLTTGANASDLVYSYQLRQIYINKKSYDATPFKLETELLTFRGDNQLNVTISKGDIGSTEVIFYVMKESWDKMATFQNAGIVGGKNTRSYTYDLSQVYEEYPVQATIEQVPTSLHMKVFAFYYPWYNNPEGPSGKLFHWDGGYAHHPLFGLYDSQDQKVIEAHILEAKAAGIDGFIVSWWGPGTPEDTALPIILKVAEENDFSVTIYYESYRPQLTSDTITQELNYVIKNYATYNSFLKVNGAPVIFIYSVDAFQRPADFWVSIKQRLEAVNGPVYLDGDVTDANYASAFDGLHWYANPDVEGGAQTFKTYTDDMKYDLNALTLSQALEYAQQGIELPLMQRALSYTVHPGFDMTKIGGTLYVDRNNGETYASFWTKALSNNPDSVLITSWNEWHEGTEIEPSVEYGYAYLNETSRFASTYKSSSIRINSTNLVLRSNITKVLRFGTRDSSILLINNSSVPAVGVSVTLSLGGELSLEDIVHSKFYSYIERKDPINYHIVIPMINPGEVITFNTTLLASPGVGEFNSSTAGYSPNGAPSLVYLEKQTQIVSDRVVVILSSNSSRVEVGSEAKIAVTSRYEYDGQPLVGSIHLNDTLAKNSEGKYFYSIDKISDNLYGLTNFTSNTVAIEFDHINAGVVVSSLVPGSITPSIAIRYESDGKAVDGATVTIDGAPLIESNSGTFQTNMNTWSPFYQLNINVECPGFTTQVITTSGWAIGNIALIALVTVAIFVVLIIMIRRRSF